jgi:serine phosphatase RsbU (regulator of sigma subunit)
MELYAGNERAHRHVTLPGLEGDVIALPSGSREGGDLYALFSCGGQRFARMVLADAVGHGFEASRVATHIHKLLHRHSNVRDTAALLEALNSTFDPRLGDPDAPLRLTTAVTANYDRGTGEFNYAYAAHPRMLLWRTRNRRWYPLGEDLEGLPLGVVAAEPYSQQSVRLESGDMVMAFSDAATEVSSPDGEQLGAMGLLNAANLTISRLRPPISLHAVAVGLLQAVADYQGTDEFKDDLTLLFLRRTDGSAF